MTTTVRVEAHLASSKEVQVFVSGQLHAVLQDGEKTDVYAYDDRLIQVREVEKASAPMPPPAAPFKYGIHQLVTIKISGEAALVIGRAEYANGTQNQYQLRYKNAAGVASEQWWEESTLQAYHGS